MAFPTTSVLDDFNRANEGPPPSANWNPTGSVTSAGGDPLKVVSNACIASNTNSSNWWNASTFGPDCEAFFTITTVATSNFRCYIRLQTPGSAAVDGYVMYVATSGTLIQAYRIDNNVLTQLGVDITGSISDGDSIGVSAVGSTLTYYKKTGGTWAALDTRSDATYGSAGYIGAFLGATDQVLDDFGGGTAVEPAATLMLTMGMLGTGRV